MGDDTHVKTTLKVSVDEDQDQRYINQYLIKEKIGEGAFGTVYLVIDTSANGRRLSASSPHASAQNAIPSPATSLASSSASSPSPNYSLTTYNENNQRIYALKEINKKKIQRKTTFSAGKNSVRGGLRLPPGAGGAAPQQADDWEMIKREIAIMKKLRHKHVIHLVEVLDDDEADCLYMVMENAQKGPIMNLDHHQQGKPLQVDLAWKYFRELVLGVEYLHFQNIAHRDLKPDNILVTNSGDVKIVDFGVSEMFNGGKDAVRKSAGSPAFMSPEMCSAKGALETFSAFKADIWAMGVVLYCMLYGAVPFAGETVFMMYEKIRSEDPPFPKDVEPLLADLFSKLFKKNPDERISISGIKEHNWLTKNGAYPLIPSSENCVDLVVVTDEEANNSITKIKSVSGIATVMKAVNRFRRNSNPWAEKTN